MFSRNWGFCDLSISNKFDLEKLDALEKLGYNTIALNTYIEEPVVEEPKRKKKKVEKVENKEKKDYIPEPVNIPKNIKESCKLNILQRVTIEFSDSGVSHKLSQSENVKKYDIIAVVPKSAQAFQYACGALDIDVISFDSDGKIPFKVPRKLYRQAVERGIFFEIMYAPAIKDSTARKNIITNSHIYHAVGKSRNILVTSGADNYMYVRDVHDVINLGFILGLNSNESLEVVRNNPRKLILKAEGRRLGKYFIIVNNEKENKTQEN